jgi:hypothetical protein
MRGAAAVDAELLHAVKQRRALHSQTLGGAISATDYPVARFQRSDNLIPFHLRKSVKHDLLFAMRMEGL